MSEATGAGPLGWMDLDKPMKKVGRVRDGRVCVCGHGAGAHAPLDVADFKVDISEAEGPVSCTPGRYNCKCTKFSAVLVTTDIRRFMGKTLGPDGEHALARGVQNALTNGVGIQWLPAASSCGRCGKPSEKVTPVAVRIRENGAVAARESTPHNFLLCEECRASLQTEAGVQELSDVSGFQYGSR